MNFIIDFFKDIFAQAAILIGLASMLGLILQKKKPIQIISGTIKTIVGFIVLNGGAALLQSGCLNDFTIIFQYAFGVTGTVPNNEVMYSIAIEHFANLTAYIMVLGMVANIILARFSRMHYVFLTGHHTLYMSALITIILNYAGLSSVWIVICGTCILGFIMVAYPALASGSMKKVTEGNDVALGHFSTTSYFISAQVGRLVGGKALKEGRAKSTEDIKFPKWLSFMRDTTVALALTMFIVEFIICLVARLKPGFSDAIYRNANNPSLNGILANTGLADHNFFVYSILAAASFSGGIYIILLGVRMMLAELIPAFKGIAEKVVPNALPAVDCPVTFPFAPNAVLIGFLMSLLGGTVGMLMIFGINGIFDTSWVIICPGLAAHFFCGATAGVFANARGGLRGCLVGAFINGLVLTILPLCVSPFIKQVGIDGNFGDSFTASIFSDADFCIVGIIFGLLGKYFQNYILITICILLFVIPIILNYVLPRKNNSDKERIEVAEENK